MTRSSGRWLDLDNRGKAAEIRSVKGEQTTNAVLQHRRNYVGVVNLTAGAAMGNQQVQEAVENSGSFLRHIECGPEASHIGDRGRHRQR